MPFSFFPLPNHYRKFLAGRLFIRILCLSLCGRIVTPAISKPRKQRSLGACSSTVARGYCREGSMKLLAQFYGFFALGWLMFSVARADDAPPDPAVIGPALAARVVGTYHDPPRQIVSQRIGDGAVLGNGDLGVMAGGPPDKLRFYFGKADFWSIQASIRINVTINERSVAKCLPCRRYGSSWFCMLIRT